VGVLNANPIDSEPGTKKNPEVDQKIPKKSVDHIFERSESWSPPTTDKSQATLVDPPVVEVEDAEVWHTTEFLGY
jgi:hypothetical protein